MAPAPLRRAWPPRACSEPGSPEEAGCLLLAEEQAGARKTPSAAAAAAGRPCCLPGSPLLHPRSAPAPREALAPRTQRTPPLPFPASLAGRLLSPSPPAASCRRSARRGFLASRGDGGRVPLRPLASPSPGAWPCPAAQELGAGGKGGVRGAAGRAGAAPCAGGPSVGAGRSCAQGSRPGRGGAGGCPRWLEMRCKGLCAGRLGGEGSVTPQLRKGWEFGGGEGGAGSAGAHGSIGSRSTHLANCCKGQRRWWAWVLLLPCLAKSCCGVDLRSVTGRIRGARCPDAARQHQPFNNRYATGMQNSISAQILPPKGQMLRDLMPHHML